MASRRDRRRERDRRLARESQPLGSPLLLLVPGAVIGASHTSLPPAMLGRKKKKPDYSFVEGTPLALLAPSAITLTPGAVPIPITAPAPTISLSLTLTPSAVAVPIATPAPALSLPLTLAPDPAAIPLAVPAPAIDVGGVLTLTPDPVTVPLLAPALTLSLTLVLVPSPVTVPILTVAPIVATTGLVTPRCPVTVGARSYVLRARARGFNHTVPRRLLTLTVRNC